MNIGLCGAHRTGKTTLAREFAKTDTGYTFVETPVSKLMADLGLDPAKDYPLDQRIAAQEHILDKLDEIYAKMPAGAIFDRTPLDAAAYMLADVKREGMTDEQHARVMSYVSRCIEVTNRRFAMLCYLPNVIPLVSAPGKAPAQPGYVEHISQLVSGLRMDERCTVRTLTMPRRFRDIQQRVVGLRDGVRRVLAMHQLEYPADEADGQIVH